MGGFESKGVSLATTLPGPNTIQVLSGASMMDAAGSRIPRVHAYPPLSQSGHCNLSLACCPGKGTSFPYFTVFADKGVSRALC